MKHPGKMFGGILLMLIGASILFSMIGVHIGGIIGLAIGAWLLYWGYSKWQEQGKWSFSSVLLLIVGALIALGGIGGVVSLAIGVILVYFGYRLLKPKDQAEETIEEEEDLAPVKTTYDVIDKEFEKLLNEHK
ncbi:hypothetical protein M3212_17875 [Alkalihalobacillus oceani]|uniref:LiaF transmembrane domain-containing protein n=1 Tax=Halalkalibacter oceani TaxID=1653776 RepID=UPI00203F9538|nr:hypothetical protein [Halalkalibacter oceani]MCM3762636.1 hypothetical protein [Halalkalibacter oceani]